jgi:hypothetical protein
MMMRKRVKKLIRKYGYRSSVEGLKNAGSDVFQ